MRISDWSSDVCSSDLVNWPDGSFDLHFRGVGDAKQLGLRLHESAKADAFRRHPPGDRAGHYRAAAIARDVRSTGRNLSSSGFGRSGRGLCLRLLIVGAGGYLLLIERSEEHTSELQSLMRISYADFCLTKNNNRKNT